MESKLQIFPIVDSPNGSESSFDSIIYEIFLIALPQAIVFNVKYTSPLSA